jgi:D-threo-aldose 1-dehydrogenase
MDRAAVSAARNGKAPLRITAMGFGGAPLGGLFSAVSEAEAHAALEAAWDAGVRYFDTAPLYGFGLSEQRFGAFLRTKPRAEFVISTKVGRLLEPARGGPSAGGLAPFIGALPNDAFFDFSGDAVRRSLDASLSRLGLDRIDIAYIHDPDDDFATAAGQAYPALHELRAQGVLGAIGAGMNQWEMLARFVETCDLDVVLLAGRYTLLDRSAAASFLPLCRARNVAIVAGGVFNSGILAEREPRADATFNYVPAPPDVLARARAMARACEAHGASLPAAALQFPLRGGAVAGILVGMRSAAEVARNVTALHEPLSADLWDELDRIAGSALVH